MYLPASTRLPKENSDRSACGWSPPMPRNSSLKLEPAICSCAWVVVPSAPSKAASNVSRHGTPDKDVVRTMSRS
ncbi:hypothetical protein D3C87_1080560 [compost metagenome]